MDAFRFTVLLLTLLASPASAITLNGNSLVYRSTGNASGNAWVLDRNGYVGTYVTLTNPGAVTIDVNATGTAGGGSDPHMNVVIADTSRGFDVASGTYSATFNLPAGTHFVRTELNNDLTLTAKQLRINSVAVTGATVANSATNANALAAADTYIANYRKGAATVNLSSLGLPAGTAVQVKLKNSAFSWGTAVPGSDSGVASYLGSNGTSTQTNFQAKLLQNFNAIGGENAGKWNDTESTRGNPTMGGVDTILNFAQSHDLTTRMHTLAYDLDSNDPTWVNNLRSQAVSSAAAKTDLRNAISSRIDYYLPPTRAAKVDAVDVFNESYQSECCRGSSSYMALFGADGIAGVFNELQQKLGSASTKLFVNEYESLIYANGNAAGYLPHIEKIMQAGVAAGYGQVVDGIGTQHYPWSLSMHSPSDILKAMQTYNVTGLPQTITELGGYSGNGLTDPQAATILGDVMRLAFGNPQSDGVYLWGFHRENGGGNLFAPGLALFDVNTAAWNNWTITPAGKIWQDQLGIQDWDGNLNNSWTTNVNTVVGADGKIGFNGYYGDYQLIIGGKSYDLSLVKGKTAYAIGQLPGDFNADGKVDGADYVVWRNSGGSVGSYSEWRQHVGQSTVIGTAVPEPSSLYYILIVAISVLMGKRAVGGRMAVWGTRRRQVRI